MQDPTPHPLRPSLPMRRLAWWAALVSAVVALVLPVLALAGLLRLGAEGLLAQAGVRGAPVPWVLETWQHILATAVLMLPALANGVALWALASGFRRLARAAPLRAQRSLQLFAGWSAGAVALAVLAGPVASVLLTWHAGPGQRQLALGLSTTHVQMLLMAALVWLFAHVLVRSYAVVQENQQFV